jgi:hypothetical protein
MQAESRLEGGMLVVWIRMRLGKQRGRKRILAPEGSELTPPSSNLARARYEIESVAAADEPTGRWRREMGRAH